MRRKGPPSEIGQLAEPIARLLDAVWQRMHWWVGAMALLYLLSGITIIRSDEVAVVLRWGKLVGATPALQEHGPGLLFAFPRPMDRIVRVQVKRVREFFVDTLARTAGADGEDDAPSDSSTLDPLTQGYALTGDQNIVHVAMVARYRVRDPAEWAFYGAAPEDALRVEVTAAMVRSLGEMGVDRVLSDGRKALIATATKRAQAGLDAAHAGLELSSLELTSLSPPTALAANFDAVQSAFIEAETAKKLAQAYAEGTIPQAQAGADLMAQSARGAETSALAAARGEAGAFLALNKEYRANPAVVRERLYRDAVERAILGAGTVRWIPPPIGGSYKGFRVTLGSGDSSAGSNRAGSPGDEDEP